jgi:hypothetical protein
MVKWLCHFSENSVTQSCKIERMRNISYTGYVQWTVVQRISLESGAFSESALDELNILWD